MTATTTPEWSEGSPIYRQLADRVIAHILDGTYPEGEMMPSVRQLASQYGVNPLTASKAVQELSELTEKRRGIGLVIKDGVRELLLKRERRQFMRDEWPQVLERIERLGIDPRDLFPGRRRV
jgi:GntR family transcriptional regulator